MIDGFAYTDGQEDQNRILSLLRLLRPHDAMERSKVRVGRDYDGGYIMIDDFQGISAAYSLGIKDDVSWDGQMADRGIDVYQYDHTIDRLPAEHPRFFWSRLGICGEGEDDENLRTLPSLMRSNEHASGDMLLKMDIEGAEWSVFATMQSGELHRFRQIVCEFHGFQHIGDDAFYEKALAACRNLAATHKVVHVHANNNTAYAIVGGVPVPACLEITFYRTEGQTLMASTQTFPTALDQPCWPGRADYQLGQFAF